jgi:hypothetical protein
MGNDEAAAVGAAAKKAKWQAQSDMLRAAMKAQRNIAAAVARGEDIRNLPMDPAFDLPDDRWGGGGGVSELNILESLHCMSLFMSATRWAQQQQHEHVGTGSGVRPCCKGDQPAVALQCVAREHQHGRHALALEP